jgi:hypothetical protein
VEAQAESGKLGQLSLKEGSDLVGKGALYFSEVTVNLLSAILIHRGTNRPDHAEHKCHLYHSGIVFTISWVYLDGRREEDMPMRDKEI